MRIWTHLAFFGYHHHHYYNLVTIKCYFSSTFDMYMQDIIGIGDACLQQNFMTQFVAISLCSIQHRCRLHYVTIRPSPPPPLWIVLTVTFCHKKAREVENLS